MLWCEFHCVNESFTSGFNWTWTFISRAFNPPQYAATWHTPVILVSTLNLFFANFQLNCMFMLLLNSFSNSLNQNWWHQWAQLYTCIQCWIIKKIPISCIFTFWSRNKKNKFAAAANNFRPPAWKHTYIMGFWNWNRSNMSILLSCSNVFVSELSLFPLQIVTPYMEDRRNRNSDRVFGIRAESGKCKRKRWWTL